MNTPVSLKPVLCEFSAKMQEIFGADLSGIILYGSCARGDNDEESDVDVLVLLKMNDEEIRPFRRKISDYSSELDLKYDVVLSPVLQNEDIFEKYKNASAFYSNVLKDGVKVA